MTAHPLVCHKHLALDQPNACKSELACKCMTLVLTFIFYNQTFIVAIFGCPCLAKGLNAGFWNFCLGLIPVPLEVEALSIFI